MKKESSKKKYANAWDNVCDTVSYGVRSPGSFVVDALTGTALITEELMFDEKPKPKSLVNDRCKNCAKVAWTGLLILGLLFAGCKGCSSENKKPTLPVRSEAGR